jgi:hypothetical protein
MTPSQQAQKVVDDWIKDRDETVALWNLNGIRSHYREIIISQHPFEIRSELIRIMRESGLESPDSQEEIQLHEQQIRQMLESLR